MAYIQVGGTLTGLSFAERAFAQIDLSGAVATASSDNKNEHVAGHVTDGDAGTRWESEHEVDPQWLEIELASLQEIYRIEIDWETASAAAYEVFFSEDGEKWTSEELEIVYKNYSTKTIRQVAEMIPTRSISAVKNKIKLIKFGKYKKNKRRSDEQ